MCKTANDADSASDSLTDFLDKISALHSQSVVGEWNIRLVTTRTGFEGLAVNMSSVWAKVDGTYKVPYSRKVIESQIAQAGGVLKSAQKFYRSEDEVKSYRRSLINGHNEGDDYVPPKPPEETTRKCVLIPLSLVKDFISSWRDDDSPPDGGGGNVPSPDPISPTDGGLVDDSVASYQDVDGNFSEKSNGEKTDEVTVSDNDSNPSYLFSEDTQSLEEEAVTTDEFPSETESENEVTDVDYGDVVTEIDQHMERLGWDIEKGQRYLVGKYGVRSRIKLSDRQLLEFLRDLKSMPTWRVGQTVLFQGLKVVIERFINDVVAVVRSSDNPKDKAFEAALVHLRISTT
ncbi:MAG: hypothetical protein MK111_21800 [Crocosphaera sp.]|uniref:hypothetical protein n=1 Tax=Crocosphaera sp. TaxID=2729996 RepID=UPI00258AE08C|nr:hypothetical protein [Crocosphaera sp.]MCH2247227.1 hypothetical protein [Crocosphaera sp.]